MCEMFDGKGSVILSGFDLVNRAGLDPAADRLLANLVAYTAVEGGPRHSSADRAADSVGQLPDRARRGVRLAQRPGRSMPSGSRRRRTRPRRRCRRTPAPGTWTPAPNSSRAAAIHSGPTATARPPASGTSTRIRRSAQGVFWASTPAGQEDRPHQSQESGRQPGQLTVAVNGKAVTGPATIAAGQTVELRSPLPADATEVSVRYTGTKTLVLLETALRVNAVSPRRGPKGARSRSVRAEALEAR